MAIPLYSSLTQVYASATPDGSTSIPDPGQIVIDDKANKIYKFAKNKHSAALVANQVVAWDLTNDTNEVKQVVTASLDRLSGGAMGAIAASGFGWIQVYGIGTLSFEGTVAIGVADVLKGVNVQFRVVKDAAAGTAATFHNYARARVAYSTGSAADKAAFISCLAF